MKNFTRKYYIGVEGVNDLLNDIEVNGKTFWQMMKDAEENRINAEGNKEDAIDYWIEKREYVNEFENYTRYQTVYENGCCRLWFTEVICKDGYCFKK